MVGSGGLFVREREAVVAPEVEARGTRLAGWGGLELVTSVGGVGILASSWAAIRERGRGLRPTRRGEARSFWEGGVCVLGSNFAASCCAARALGGEGVGVDEGIGGSGFVEPFAAPRVGDA